MNLAIRVPIILRHHSHLILPWLHWARMPGSKRNYPSLDRPVVSRDTKLNNQGILFVCPPSTSDMRRRYQDVFTVIVGTWHQSFVKSPIFFLENDLMMTLKFGTCYDGITVVISGKYHHYRVNCKWQLKQVVYRKMWFSFATCVARLLRNRLR